MLKDFLAVLGYREMLKTTVSKELRARYKGSALGFLWTFVNPLLQLLVYSIAFRYVMRVSVPGVDFTIYLFVGLVPWTCFSTSLLMGSNVIVANSNLIKKIHFPRLILPISSVLGNVVNLILTMCILLPVLWLNGYEITINYVYIIPIVLFLGLLNLGFVLIFSGLNVYFRDLEHLLSVALMAWMYLSPIIYSADIIPGPAFALFKLNPMYPVVTAFQDILVYRTAPDILGLLYLACFGLFLLFVGYAAYSKMQRRFAEEL